MRTFKLIIVLIIVCACLAGGLYIADKFQLISLPFAHKDLTIEKTANVVTEIKKIGEFTTACYYEELALKDTRIDTTTILGFERYKKNEIVLIGKGCVRAGFDLAKINPEDISISGDTLSMKLPAVEIFDIIINPSDFSVEYEDGDWNNENTKAIKNSAKEQIEKNSIANDILKKAENVGLERLKTLFKTFGYTEVVLNI